MNNLFSIFISIYTAFFENLQVAFGKKISATHSFACVCLCELLHEFAKQMHNDRYNPTIATKPSPKQVLLG